MDLLWLAVVWLSFEPLTYAADNSTLACYDCSESFKHVWDPNTECQMFPTTAPLRTCLDTEHYCKVERTSYKDRTVTIARGCADICLYGCYASGFGVTKLTCTACCQDRGCNTTNTAARIITDSMECILILHVFVIFMFCGKITSGQDAYVIYTPTNPTFI